MPARVQAPLTAGVAAPKLSQPMCLAKSAHEWITPILVRAFADCARRICSMISKLPSLARTRVRVSAYAASSSFQPWLARRRWFSVPYRLVHELQLKRNLLERPGRLRPRIGEFPDDLEPLSQVTVNLSDHFQRLIHGALPPHVDGRAVRLNRVDGWNCGQCAGGIPDLAVHLFPGFGNRGEPCGQGFDGLGMCA